MVLFLDAVITAISLFLYALCVYSFVRIFKKAGLGNWGCVSVLPVIWLILLMVLAFSDWPATEKK